MEATFGTIIIALVLLVPYFLPTIIAFLRGHQSKIAILALNLFLGWSLIGWVISLVWSLTSKKQVVVVQQA